MESMHASTSMPTSAQLQATTAVAKDKDLFQQNPHDLRFEDVQFDTEEDNTLSKFWTTNVVSILPRVCLAASVDIPWSVSLEYHTVSGNKRLAILFRSSENLNVVSRTMIRHTIQRVFADSMREAPPMVFIKGPVNNGKQKTDGGMICDRISERTHSPTNESTYASELDDPKEAVDFPHHRRYYRKVGMGSSIGISECPHVSATVGGYVNVNDTIYIITAGQMRNTCECSRSSDVQSPSISDAKYVHRQSVGELYERKTSSTHVLPWETIFDETGELISKSLDEELEYFSRVLSESEINEQNRRRFAFGKVRHRSGLGPSSVRRSRNPRSLGRSHRMDWSLIEVTEKHRKGQNCHRFGPVRCPDVYELRSERNNPNGLGNPCRGIVTVTGGEMVHFVGARSGFHYGYVDSTLVKFQHEDGVISYEWAIYPVFEGVNAFEPTGDSGSWVIGDDDRLLGQLWGWHNGYLLFTPIVDIFADIAESMDVEYESITLSESLDTEVRNYPMDNGTLGSLQSSRLHRTDTSRREQAQSWELLTMMLPDDVKAQVESHDEVSGIRVQSQANKRPYEYDEKSELDKLGSLKKRDVKKDGLTCLRNDFECGEERPTCANCTQSKQMGEEYNKRIGFEPSNEMLQNQSVQKSNLSIALDKDQNSVESLDHSTSDGSLEGASSIRERGTSPKGSKSGIPYSTQPTTARDSEFTKAPKTGPNAVQHMIGDEQDDGESTDSDDSDIPLTSENSKLIVKTLAETLDCTLPKDSRLTHHQSIGIPAFLNSVEHLLRSYCVEVTCDNPGFLRTRQFVKTIRRLRDDISQTVYTILSKPDNPGNANKQGIFVLSMLDADKSKEPSGRTKPSEWLKSNENKIGLSHPPETWQDLETDDETDPILSLLHSRLIYNYNVEDRAFSTLIKGLNASVERHFGDQTHLIAFQIQRTFRQLHLAGAITGEIPSASFFTNWDPLRFLTDQYPKGRLQPLRDVLAITGNSEDAQMCTVEQYLRQTWVKFTFELVDHLTYVISAGANGMMSPNIIYSTETRNILVHGPEDFIVTVGQQISWLGAACRHSNGTLALCYTELSAVEISESSYPTFHLSYEASSSGIEDSNSCWHELVGDSVIAYGFPIPKRTDEVHGLHLPVELMAMLGRIPFATYFEGGYVLKGRSFAIVPLQYRGNSVQWHLFQNKDGGRIEYEDLSELAPNRLLVEERDISAFMSAESYLGWCTECTVNLATDNYDYLKVKYTKSKSKQKLTISMDSLMIGFQQWGAAGVNFTVGRHQGFYRNEKSDWYGYLLHDSSKIHVVLQDMEARRAWHTDAETMILHIILHRHELGVFSTSSSPVHLIRADPRMSNSVRKAMMLNRDTSVAIDKHLKEDGVNDKQFYHLVNELFQVFDGLQATQRQFTRKRGFELKGLQGHEVCGWEYLDIVDRAHHPESRFAKLEETCGEWPKLMRQLNAVVLYGSFFQDVFEPSASGKLPQGQDYLAMLVPALNQLYERYGTLGTDDELAQITSEGARLCRSQYLFDPCPDCTIASSSNSYCGCISDRIQYLEFESKKKITKLAGLGNNGAVIIGKKPHTSKIWKKISERRTRPKNTARLHAQAMLTASSRKIQPCASVPTVVSLSSTTPTPPSQSAPPLPQPLTIPQAQHTPLLYQQSSVSHQIP